MNKKIMSLIAGFVFMITIFAGCKVETPEEAAATAAKMADMNVLMTDRLGESSEEDITVAEEKPVDVKKDKENSETKEEAKETKVTSNSEVTKASSKEDKNSYSNSKKVSVAEANKHRPSGSKDKYQTDPTPPGMPKPVEPEDVKVDKNKAYTCTLSITCNTILNNMDKFNMDKIDCLPKDGVIYSERTVVFYGGESVFDVLLRETKKNKIHMEFEMTPIYNSNYIEGINNLYEFDCGELSGWMYKVNGWFPNYGCSRYQLKPGDRIEWVYTCDLGRDVGCEWLGDTLD